MGLFLLLGSFGAQGCTPTDSSNFVFSSESLSDAGTSKQFDDSISDAGLSVSISPLCPDAASPNCSQPSVCLSTPDASACGRLSDTETLNRPLSIGGCSLDPCQHDALCQETDAGFLCQCSRGYDGELCENDIDECQNTPCLNGGTCSNLDGSFSCLCKEGFEGSSCDINTDDCTGEPCDNGGVCKDGLNSFVCECPLGFAGTLCEDAVDQCADEPCQNALRCEDQPPVIVCECLPGFDGRLCESNINDCEAFFCANGGACIDGISSATCECQPGFSGPRCVTNINDCANTPCTNGTCEDQVNDFRCECGNSGFEGRLCEQPSALGDGSSCTIDGQCQSGNCVESSDDASSSICCQTPCAAGVSCEPLGPDNATCVGTLLGGGGDCLNGSQCTSGVCRIFFTDADLDGFPPGGAAPQSLCTGAGLPGTLTTTAPVGNNIDCSDSDLRANPDATTPQPAGSSGDGSFDFNCDGLIDQETAIFDLAACQSQAIGSDCSAIASGFDPSTEAVACGQTGSLLACISGVLGNCIAQETNPAQPQLCL